jgi:hypothetical protein
LIANVDEFIFRRSSLCVRTVAGWFILGTPPNLEKLGRDPDPIPEGGLKYSVPADLT